LGGDRGLKRSDGGGGGGGGGRWWYKSGTRINNHDIEHKKRSCQIPDPNLNNKNASYNF